MLLYIIISLLSDHFAIYGECVAKNHSLLANENVTVNAKMSAISKAEEVEKKIIGVSSNNSKSSRIPIKLTMKQGLLLNQVLSAYALEDSEDELCRQHTKEFKEGLRAFEPWALQSKYSKQFQGQST